MAKASFSAYLLGKSLPKTGEKVHFLTKKTRPILVVLFVPSLLPSLASKWLKYAVFAFQEGKKVGRKRGLRQKHSGSYFCEVGVLLTLQKHRKD